MENEDMKSVRGSDLEEFEIEYSIKNHRICTDNIINVPFRDVFDNNPKCKNYLLEEFCNSEPRPNLRLYMRQYYPDEKIRLEFNKNEYREKHKEFFRLVDEGKLATTYYLPFLPETKTLVTLSKVDSIVKAIREIPFIIPPDDIQNYCKIQANEIIDILNCLQLPELKQGVIKSIINDNYNGLFFEGMKRKDGEIMKRKDGDDATLIWNYMKESLNGLLKKEIASSNGADFDVPFYNLLNSSDGSKQIVIQHINMLKPSILKPRGWAIVLLALHEERLISLFSSIYSKTSLYKTFNDEFNLEYTDKSYNDYITPYLSDNKPDSKKEITKAEVAEMRLKIGVKRCDT